MNKISAALGLVALFGLAFGGLGLWGTTAAAPVVPTAPTLSILVVPFDEPAPEKHHAFVLDVSGDLLDGKSKVVDDDTLRRLLQPPKGTEPIRYIKLTVVDEEKTMVPQLSNILKRVRACQYPEGETILAVHLKNLKLKPREKK